MIVQPYRPVTYTIGSASSGMPGMGNTTQGMPGMGGGGMTGQPPQVTSGSPMTPTGTVVSTPQPVFEQSYIENILRLNLGKTGTFYMTYENNSEWNAKIFKGVIEAAGRDHIIISDRATGQRFLLLMINLDYVTFDEPLTYQYPGAPGNGSRNTTRNCW
ncbi:spore coat protein GerQ [Paenibacillus wynnii]|uniref:spore coat protein GerQ n=1 Tax=Paenibacillus wynnii TaxID=268407 RepID=UPI00279100FF|nr:spore germination protein Q [Paenibacillus wynnii]